VQVIKSLPTKGLIIRFKHTLEMRAHRKTPDGATWMRN